MITQQIKSNKHQTAFFHERLAEVNKEFKTLKTKIKLLVSYNDYFKNVSGKNGFTAKRTDYFRWCEENNYQAEKLREAELRHCYIGDEFCMVWI
jgi:intein-encoded DNA endonuclease-like protein